MTSKMKLSTRILLGYLIPCAVFTGAVVAVYMESVDLQKIIIESDRTNSIVRQGMLESANLNPIEATVTMMALQRHAELLERTLSVFQNDLDKTAIEDMARD